MCKWSVHDGYSQIKKSDKNSYFRCNFHIIIDIIYDNITCMHVYFLILHTHTLCTNMIQHHHHHPPCTYTHLAIYLSSKQYIFLFLHLSIYPLLWTVCWSPLYLSIYPSILSIYLWVREEAELAAGGGGNIKQKFCLSSVFFISQRRDRQIGRCIHWEIDRLIDISIYE